jgi:hypothetical protein
MKQAIASALIVFALLEVRSCAAPAHADSRELAQLVDELRQIRRVLERMASQRR